ncbi:MAG TPA: class I SAM-dependent methyltransferase [Candidatus Limnocylindrales bacterium]|nr:class I SAM-dependent methyltransferase [Candidatus Limnocylindrales bacterium]
MSPPRIAGLRSLADNSDPTSLANRLRDRRFGLFRELLATVPPPVRILDVGGTPQFWSSRADGLPGSPEIVVLNLRPFEPEGRVVSSIVGDAVDMSEISSGSFDVVFCNSVIEHVGSLERQARMASEIRRVAARYFVQTPNRYFPIEPHFLFPMYQFLPVRVRVALLRRMSLGWHARTPDRADAERQVNEIRLMSGRELASVFPGARLHRERFFGVTKSLIAYGGWGPVQPPM